MEPLFQVFLLECRFLKLKKSYEYDFDVHMMVEEPGRYIEDIKNAGADIITVHAEACTHLDRVVN